VPARIVSKEIGKRCIVSCVKMDYSFSGFRRTRSVRSSQ
jgi:hypothetical protein